MSSAPSVETLLKEGRRLLKAGKIIEAVAALRQALVLNDDHPKLHESLATALFAANELEQAARHFERAAELDPTNGRALINQGAVLNRLGEYAKAVPVLRRGMQRSKTAAGFYNLGFAQRHLGQLGMAMSAYREAVRLEPENADAHFNLANVLLEIRSYKQAREHYREALRLRPDFEAARRGLTKTDEEAAEARQEISPFGRLVDVTQTGPATLTFNRELSEIQRLRDRKELYELCQRIAEATQALATHLRDEMDPAFGGLVRGTAEAGLSTRNLNAAHYEFQQVVQQACELRRTLKRRCLELRAHEELMYTPEIGETGGSA